MFFKTKQRKKKFFSYYKPYIKPFILDLMFASLSTIITLVIPLLIRHVTGTLLTSQLSNTINRILQVGVFITVLLIIRAFMIFYTDAKGHAIGAMMESDMREELFEHYQTLPFQFYDEQQTGELTSRIFQDTLELGEFFHHAPEDIILYIVRFIGAFAILYRINVRLAFISISLLPFMGIIAFYGAKNLSKINKVSRQIIGEVNAQVEDSISGIRVIQSYTNADYEIKTFKKGNKRFLNTRIRWYKSESIIYGILDFFVQIISIVVIISGAFLIINSYLSIEDLLTFILYIGFLSEPLTRIMWMFSQYQAAYTSFHRFMDIIEIVPKIQDKPNAVKLEKVDGFISFKNVSFSYLQDIDGNHETEIIKGLNLEIAAGEYIAIVGASGVGKTTLCSLIPRFYDVQTGEIRIDNQNINDVQLESLRKQIGVVSQDTYLFTGSIYDNIIFGNHKASFEEVQLAAQKAGIADFINHLPNGYDTSIGQRGIKLSGGQKQRISIARAFLKNPAILIFDEATSALDYQNEKIIQSSLEELSKNRTTIVIAHRLTTIQNAQRIIVLQDKKIVEEGTHQELLAKGGVYTSLYRNQDII